MEFEKLKKDFIETIEREIKDGEDVINFKKDLLKKVKITKTSSELVVLLMDGLKNVMLETISKVEEQK